MAFKALLGWAALLCAGCGGPEGTQARTEYCRSLCSSQAECEAGLNELELERHGSATCELIEGGLTPCVQACHSALLEPGREESARDCMDCLLDASDPVCRVGWDECRDRCEMDRNAVRHATSAVIPSLSCWLGDARPTSSCSAWVNPVGVHVVRAGEPSSRLSASYAGTATVTGTSPFTFVVPAGETYSLDVWGSTPPLFSAGAGVLIQFQQDCPFGCSSRVVLRSRQGSLLWAAWSMWRQPGPLGEVAFRYEPSECRGVSTDFSGVIGLDIVLPDQTRVSPGGMAASGSFLVRNGGSVARYAIRATDTSEDSWSGAVERVRDD